MGAIKQALIEVDDLFVLALIRQNIKSNYKRFKNRV
ncbi:MAG: hypothetical protein CM15mV121_290 [uncultured marine virus]|nr:MAG: hypothetical protein CM15mV121_290 [uncultured marine virus]